MAQKLFIVIDGMDGTGKSEMVKLLHNYLFTKDKKCRVLTTREPTNGKYGSLTREILAKETDPKKNADKLLELFLKDREEHIRKIIRPFLESSDKTQCNIIICDRYYYSTIAFQHTQGLDLKEIIDKNKQFLKPDIAFFLDLDPKKALERIDYREKEKFEQLEFMKKLRQSFLDMPNHIEDNIVIINASKTKEEVFESIKKEIDKLLF